MRYKDKEVLLDNTIINDFRDAVNSSNIFYYEDEYKCLWNLICSMMDRIDSCIKYINSFDISQFETEESLVNFMTYCSLIYNAVLQLFRSIGDLDEYYKSKEKNKFEVFKEDFARFMSLYDENINDSKSTDDEFFEFLRSIMFAHPTDTHRPKFVKKGDKLFSPFVLIKPIFMDDIKNAIGVAIYSLIDDKTIHFWFSANHLIDFVRSKYELLRIATEWVNEQIQRYSNKWKQTKVNRHLQGVELLNNIKCILEERHDDEVYSINEAIKLLECEVSDKTNFNIVLEYKEKLIDTFDELSDWVDSLQSDEKYPENFYKMLNPRPKILYPDAHYQIEKIDEYLDDRIIDFREYIDKRNNYIKTNNDAILSNFEWGVFQAEMFFIDLGKYYVHFDLSKICTAEEVRLLSRVALYFEMKNQEKGNINENIIKLIDESNRRNKRLKVVDSIKLSFPNKETMNIDIVDASINNGN